MRLVVLELDRIRQKVWAGEQLNAQELDTLKRAQGSEPGPSLRTTMAQALINADEPRQALDILEVVRRDFPQDLQTHLAVGRACVSLERWADAEASLKRALELNPGDPEALKALAVVAMRRGEWLRARAYVDEVLQVDPLDDEAQQLSLELKNQAPAELTDAPSIGDYTSALVAALKRRSTPHLLQKSQLIVRLMRGGVARLDLEGLHRDFLETGQSLAVAVEAVAQELAERAVGLPPTKLALLAKVLPLLRDSSFLERGEGAARREGPAGLWVFYAVDDPELVRYVPEGVLHAARLTLEQLDEAAWKNLALKPVDVRAITLDQGALRLSPQPTGLWCVAHGDGHDAARLLLPEQQDVIARVVGPSPWRVYLGLRELVLICREDDRPCVARLENLEAAREGIPGAFRLHAGRLEALPDWDV